VPPYGAGAEHVPDRDGDTRGFAGTDQHGKGEVGSHPMGRKIPRDDEGLVVLPVAAAAGILWAAGIGVTAAALMVIHPDGWIVDHSKSAPENLQRD